MNGTSDCNFKKLTQQLQSVHATCQLPPQPAVKRITNFTYYACPTKQRETTLRHLSSHPHCGRSGPAQVLVERCSSDVGSGMPRGANRSEKSLHNTMFQTRCLLGSSVSDWACHSESAFQTRDFVTLFPPHPARRRQRLLR